MSGCALLGSTAPAAPGSTGRVYFQALPSRTLFLWDSPVEGSSPRQALDRFVSALDPAAVAEKGDAGVVIRGPYATAPDTILIRWRRERRFARDGLLVEATSVNGRPQEGATDLVAGLRAWMSIHGVKWSDGPPSGVRAFPHLAEFARLWEAAGAVFDDMGLVHKGVGEEAVGAAWNRYGRTGHVDDWVLYDAFLEDPRRATEVAVCLPSRPFAGECERDVLLKILLRLLPGEQARIRAALY
jgi:hypothetical protein